MPIFSITSIASDMTRLAILKKPAGSQRAIQWRWTRSNAADGQERRDARTARSERWPPTGEHRERRGLQACKSKRESTARSVSTAEFPRADCVPLLKRAKGITGRGGTCYFHERVNLQSSAP